MPRKHLDELEIKRLQADLKKYESNTFKHTSEDTAPKEINANANNKEKREPEVQSSSGRYCIVM